MEAVANMRRYDSYVFDVRLQQRDGVGAELQLARPAIGVVDGPCPDNATITQAQLRIIAYNDVTGHVRGQAPPDPDPRGRSTLPDWGRCR
jgi:hypothetical protein